MVFKRGEFVGLTVDSAVDNQRQLVKFESKENDRRSRELWWEKSNMWASLAGLTIATEVISACVQPPVKAMLTFRRNRDVQFGQRISTSVRQIHVYRKVVSGVAERLDALEAQALGCFQKRSRYASVEIFHQEEVQPTAESPSQDLTGLGRKAGPLEGAEREVVEMGKLVHNFEHLGVRDGHKLHR